METVETPQPTAPVEQKSTDWTKIILAAVVGFGLLAGSAYAGYYYGTQQVQPAEELTPAVSQPTTQPTPTPTPIPNPDADWKTYKNTALGFAIDYPASLEVIDNTAKLKIYLQEVDEQCQREGGCGGGPRASWVIDFVSVSDKQKIATDKPVFYERPYQFTLSIYESTPLNVLYGEKAPAGYEQYLTDYLIGGKGGLRSVQKGDPTSGQNPYLLYGVDNKGKTYSFTFPNRTSGVQDLEYTENILSTFEFP